MELSKDCTLSELTAFLFDAVEELEAANDENQETIFKAIEKAERCRSLRGAQPYLVDLYKALTAKHPHRFCEQCGKLEEDTYMHECDCEQLCEDCTRKHFPEVWEEHLFGFND